MKASNSVSAAGIKNYGDTNFITGMRAIAALAVVLIHTGGSGLREINFVTNNLVDFCRNGVYVFFVISGFSVAHSCEASNSFFIYLKRQFFRIFPLYYFWIFTTCLTGLNSTYWLNEFGSKIDSYNLLMHLGFVSFLDYRIANTVIGVEWSIPITVFWYLITPLLVNVMRTNIFVLVSILLSLILYISTKHWFLHSSIQNASLIFQWSPIPYLFSYVLGVAAYKFRQKLSQRNDEEKIVLSNQILLMTGLSSTALIIFPKLSQIFYDDFIFVSLVTFSLVLYGNSKSSFYRFLFTNPICLYLGTISYGIYLAHFPIITIFTDFCRVDNSFVRFVLVLSLSVLVSTITFYTVEKIGIDTGKKFSR